MWFKNQGFCSELSGRRPGQARCDSSARGLGMTKVNKNIWRPLDPPNLSHFAILVLNIILLTLYSSLIYLKFKKNIFEHLILNIYNVSLWTILFVPISMTSSLVLDNTDIARFFFIPFHLLILIWNSKVFKLRKLKRFLFVIINLSLFYGTLLFLIFYSNL